MSPRIELETRCNEGGALTNCACTLPPTLVFKNYPLRLCSHVSDFILRTEIFLLWIGPLFTRIRWKWSLKRIFSKTLSRVCLVPRRHTLVLVVQCVLVSWVFSCVHTTMLKYRVSFRKSFGQSWVIPTRSLCQAWANSSGVDYSWEPCVLSSKRLELWEHNWLGFRKFYP